MIHPSFQDDSAASQVELVSIDHPGPPALFQGLLPCGAPLNMRAVLELFHCELARKLFLAGREPWPLSPKQKAGFL